MKKLCTILLHAAQAAEEEERQVRTHAQDRDVNGGAAVVHAAAAAASNTGEEVA